MIIPMPFYSTPDIIAFLLFMRIHVKPTWKLYRTEWEIYSCEDDLAGSIDCVMRDECTGHLILIDWKRTKELERNMTSPYGTKMRAPMNHIYSCKGAKYELQLNIYRHIIHKRYGMSVSDMLIVCIHPDCGGVPFVHNVPILEEETNYLMLYHRKQHMDSIERRVMANLDRVAGRSEAVIKKRKRTSEPSPFEHLV